MSSLSQRVRAATKRALSEEKTQRELQEQRKRPKKRSRAHQAAIPVEIYEDPPVPATPQAGADAAAQGSADASIRHADEDAEDEDQPEEISESSSEDLEEFVAVLTARLNKETVHVDTLPTSMPDFSEIDVEVFINEAQEKVPQKTIVQDIIATLYWSGQPVGQRLQQSFSHRQIYKVDKVVKLLRKERARIPAKADSWRVSFDVILGFDATAVPPPAQPVQAPRSQPQRRRTATQQQLADLPQRTADQIAIEGETAGIITHWQCGNRACRNYSRTCWVALRDGELLPGREHNHFRVSLPILRNWNTELLNGRSTVEDPSENIRAQLRQHKADCQRELRAPLREIPGNVNSPLNASLTEFCNVMIAEATGRMASARSSTQPSTQGSQGRSTRRSPFGRLRPQREVVKHFFRWLQVEYPSLAEEVEWMGYKFTNTYWNIDDLEDDSKLTASFFIRYYKCEPGVLWEMQHAIREWKEATRPEDIDLVDTVDSFRGSTPHSPQRPEDIY